MKTFLSALAVLLVLTCTSTAAADAGAPEAPKVEMMTYYMGLIYRGPSWTPDVTPEVERIQEGHMANIRKMAETGKLVLAGPFENNGDLRGIFLFKTETGEEARALVANDPAVQAGRLRVDLIPWFGPKGIQVVQTPPSTPVAAPAAETKVPANAAPPAAK